MPASTRPLSRACLHAPALTRLATLAVLGLAAAHPQAARAQTLTLGDGDNVTVSGAGTVNLNPADPYVNSTTSYSDAQNSKYTVETNGTAIFSLGAGGTLTSTSFSDGLRDLGSGAITISGGAIEANGEEGIGLSTSSSGATTVSGGTIEANGKLGVGLLAVPSGATTVSGGTIEANGLDGIGLFTLDSGVVTVRGGTIEATGQGGIGLFASDSGTIDLFSQGDTPFLIDDVPMNNTTLGNYTSGTDTISGTLLDGQTLDTTFENFGGAINLNVGTPPVLAATPEPSAFVGLGIGLLGLGALGVKAKRRHAA